MRTLDITNITLPEYISGSTFQIHDENGEPFTFDNGKQMLETNGKVASFHGVTVPDEYNGAIYLRVVGDNTTYGIFDSNGYGPEVIE